MPASQMIRQLCEDRASPFCAWDRPYLLYRQAAVAYLSGWDRGDREIVGRS
jgi:hypothetical protein